ncbi:MAG: hypothetical protein Q8L81_07590 [Bacteroidota bacterium]|nr:hypothetical protein [Bacteroidota bacterium]
MKNSKIRPRLILISNYAGWKNISINGDFSSQFKSGNKIEINKDDYPSQYEILKKEIDRTGSDILIKAIVISVSETYIDTIVELCCPPRKKSVLDYFTIRI